MCAGGCSAYTGSHPGDQVLRCRSHGSARARGDSDPRHVARASSKQLRALHRCGRRSCGRYHQPLSFASDPCPRPAARSFRIYVRHRGSGTGSSILRTDRDLPPKLVAYGVLGLIVAIALAPPLHMNIGGAVLIVLFGFLFVTVSSRLTGEIGSSSNPISGMTLSATRCSSLARSFVLFGWTGPHYYVTALSTSARSCASLPFERRHDIARPEDGFSWGLRPACNKSRSSWALSYQRCRAPGRSCSA